MFRYLRNMTRGALSLANDRSVVIIASVTLLLGIALVLASGMGFKWFFMVVMSLLVLATAVVFPNLRLFLVLLLVACIPVAIEYDVFSRPGKQVVTEHFGGAPDTLVIHLIDFPIIALCIFWLIDLATHERVLPKWESIDSAITLMILASALSLYVTSEYGLLGAELVRYLKYYLLLWILRTYLIDRDFATYALYVVVLMAGFEFFIAALQYFLFFSLPFSVGGVAGSQFDLVNNTLIQRVSGTVGHANTFAAYLLFPMAASFVLLVSRKPLIIRVASAGLFVAVCLSLVLTFSRNAWMVTAFSVLLLFAIGVATRRISGGFVFSVFCLGMLLLALLVFSGLAETIFVRIFDDDGKAYDSRWDLIGVAINMLVDQPLFGIGLNSFEEQMSRFDETGVTNIIQQPVHNFVFLVAAETGLPALLFFFLICRQIIRKVLQLVRIDNEDAFIFGFSAGVAFLALFISNQFDVTLRKGSVIGMSVLFLALLMTTWQRLANDRK